MQVQHEESYFHKINPQEEHPDDNMNLDLNISNQPLQYLKNSTVAPWSFAGIIVPISPTAGPKLAATHVGLDAGLVRCRPGAPAAALACRRPCAPPAGLAILPTGHPEAVQGGGRAGTGTVGEAWGRLQSAAFEKNGRGMEQGKCLPHDLAWLGGVT
jgi:hypothetical protein